MFLMGFVSFASRGKMEKSFIGIYGTSSGERAKYYTISLPTPFALVSPTAFWGFGIFPCN